MGIDSWIDHSKDASMDERERVGEIAIVNSMTRIGDG